MRLGSRRSSTAWSRRCSTGCRTRPGSTPGMAATRRSAPSARTWRSGAPGVGRARVFVSCAFKGSRDFGLRIARRTTWPLDRWGAGLLFGADRVAELAAQAADGDGDRVGEGVGLLVPYLLEQ